MFCFQIKKVHHLTFGFGYALAYFHKSEYSGFKVELQETGGSMSLHYGTDTTHFRRY